MVDCDREPVMRVCLELLLRRVHRGDAPMVGAPSQRDPTRRPDPVISREKDGAQYANDVGDHEGSEGVR